MNATLPIRLLLAVARPPPALGASNAMLPAVAGSDPAAAAGGPSRAMSSGNGTLSAPVRSPSPAKVVRPPRPLPEVVQNG